MAANLTTQIITPITCRHCFSQFVPPPGLDLDKAPTQRTSNFVNRLITHLKERHREVAAQSFLRGQEYGGMLMLLNFNISGEVREQADRVRWQINKATRAVEVTDKRIHERVLQLLAEDLTAEEIERTMQPGRLGFKYAALLREMRDVMTEANRY